MFSHKCHIWMVSLQYGCFYVHSDYVSKKKSLHISHILDFCFLSEVFVSFFYEPLCAYPNFLLLQMFFHKSHIWMVSLQYEFFCGLWGDWTLKNKKLWVLIRIVFNFRIWRYFVLKLFLFTRFWFSSWFSNDIFFSMSLICNKELLSWVETIP